MCMCLSVCVSVCVCLCVVQIMHNDVYAKARITNSVIQRNLGNGVSTRRSFFELFNCTLAENTAAGFEYNPSYTSYEALQVSEEGLNYGNRPLYTS